MSRALIGPLCALVFASCMPVLDGEEYNLAGQEVRLTFLHTADIHSRLIPYDFAPLQDGHGPGLIPEAGPFGGATRIAALIKRERSEGDRVLHLDSGDCFQGAPIFNQNLGEVEFRFLSNAAAGRRGDRQPRVRRGRAQLRAEGARLRHASRCWRPTTTGTAHRHREQQPAPPTSPRRTPSRTMKGLRVGIIGMANISSLNSIVEGGNSLQVTPLEQNEAARAYVELLRPVTDLVVIVSHLGLTEDQELVQGYEAYYEYGARQAVHRAREQPVEDPRVVRRRGRPPSPSSACTSPACPASTSILGGHLHVVLNPPQLLTDPAGRKVAAGALRRVRQVRGPAGRSW